MFHGRLSGCIPTVRGGWVRTTVLMCLLGLVLLLPRPLAAQGGGTLVYGEAVTGDVTSRLGDEWVFAGCLGETVTLTLQSDGFAGYMELYGPTGRRSLAAAGAEGKGGIAVIRSFVLPASGEYTVIAAGSSIQDRGPYTLVLESDGQPAESTRRLAGELRAGEPVTGVITSRLPEEWSYRGCKADVVGITLESRDFTPFIEILAPPSAPTATAESLVQVTGVGDTASVTGLALPAGGEYILAVAGAGIRDRGSYTLTLNLQARGVMTPTSLPAATAVATPLPPTSTPTPVPPTAAPTHTRVPGNTQPICVVLTNSLNLRPGPGLSYDPPLGALARDTLLFPLQRNPSTSWIRVQVYGSNDVGWVSAGSQYIDCNINLNQLPLGVIPPTYTPTATPISTPTATPTATPISTRTPARTPPGWPMPLYADIVETGAYNNDDSIMGAMTFRVVAYDPNVGYNDGDGIDWVRLEVRYSGSTVHERQENNAAYCAFGGGEPDCTIWDFDDHNGMWPSGVPIADGQYTLHARIHADSGQELVIQRDIYIQTTATSHWTPSSLYADIVETGAYNNDDSIMGAMTFRVVAYDPNVGYNDGDGIDWVRLEVRYNGSTVHERQENNAAYCAFGGGEPDCTIWYFDDHNGMWPSGVPIAGGQYTLHARIRADSGEELVIQRDITIGN